MCHRSAITITVSSRSQTTKSNSYTICVILNTQKSSITIRLFRILLFDTLCNGNRTVITRIRSSIISKSSLGTEMSEMTKSMLTSFISCMIKTTLLSQTSQIFRKLKMEMSFTKKHICPRIVPTMGRFLTITCVRIIGLVLLKCPIFSPKSSRLTPSFTKYKLPLINTSVPYKIVKVLYYKRDRRRTYV